MKEKENWFKRHKNDLICFGIGFGTGVCTELINAAVTELLHRRKEPNQRIRYYIPDQKPVSVKEPVPIPAESSYPARPRHCITEQFEVNRHLRKLPENRHASAKKIATASENGFTLGDCQTWVTNYTKGVSA